MTNPSKTFIPDFTRMVVKEKATMDKPDILNYPDIEQVTSTCGYMWRMDNADYEQHLASLREYPAPWLDKKLHDRELVEGVDFKIGWHVKTQSYQGETDHYFLNERDADKKYQEWSKWDGKLMSHTTKPILSSIPFTTAPIPQHEPPETEHPEEGAAYLQEAKGEGEPEWKEKFIYWLTNNMYINKSTADIIISHVERYVKLPTPSGEMYPAGFVEWANDGWIYCENKMWVQYGVVERTPYTTAELYAGPYQEYLQTKK